MASLQKRGDNSYFLVVEGGYDANGKRIRHTRTVKADGIREARKKLAEFQTEVEAGEYIAPEKMRFAAFVEDWKAKYADRELSRKTLETYMLHLNNRIIPAFGHKRLDEIKPIQIVNFIHSLEQEGSRADGQAGRLSSGTIELIYRTFKNILNRAVDWKMIKSNPMDGIKKPKVETREMEVYDEQETQLLFRALEKEKLCWRVMITLALTTGLRRGELLGLEWKHVNLEEGTIDVRQSISFIKDEGYIVKEPKTKKSIRMVSVPASVISELRLLKHQCNVNRLKAEKLWEGGDHFFLFSVWNGKPFNPHSVKRWWTRFTKKNKLKYIRFHDLRHTSATLLINKGVHAKIISERLGHSNILTTMNTYGHALRSADKEAAKHFDSLFDTRKA